MGKPIIETGNHAYRRDWTIFQINRRSNPVALVKESLVLKEDPNNKNAIFVERLSELRT